MALTRLNTNAFGTSVNLASNVTGTLPAANGGTGATSFVKGRVLQVVHGTTTSNTQITSTSYTATSLSASITPSSSSNKILVLVSQQVQAERATNAELNVYVQLLRGSTDLSTNNPVTIDAGTGSSGKIGIRGMATAAYLDSPSTTSATTYSTKGKLNTTSDSATVRFQEGSGRSDLTLLEIEA